MVRRKISKLEFLALAFRDAIVDSECIDSNEVDIRKLDYKILCEKLDEYGFKNEKDLDEESVVDFILANLIKYYRKNHSEKRFLIRGLMLNPCLCNYFKKQLNRYGWVYSK